MDVLTREQAIKRIKDIRRLKEINHLVSAGASTADNWSRHKGAQLELMAIFDIREEELKLKEESIYPIRLSETDSIDRVLIDVTRPKCAGNGSIPVFILKAKIGNVLEVYEFQTLSESLSKYAGIADHQTLFDIKEDELK